MILNVLLGKAMLELRSEGGGEENCPRLSKCKAIMTKGNACMLFKQRDVFIE